MQAMEVASAIEVDVNGQGIFLVNKEILASFSGRLNKLFNTHNGCPSSRLKVIFHDFPGGSHWFELMARFLYSNGNIETTPFNLVPLTSASHFMEIGSNKLSGSHLVDQLNKSIEGISLWTWSELLVALRQCQDLLPAMNPPILLDKILDCLVARINLHLPSVPSPPFQCSSENYSFRPSSSDTSTASYSTRFNCSSTWWFEDLLFLNSYLLDKFVRTMVNRKLDHATIFKFLVFHLRLKCHRVSPSRKCKIVDIVMRLLPLLERDSLYCKGLFEILRVMSSVKKINKHHEIYLEKLIGQRLDQATLDHLLVPPRRGKRYKFDVCLVIRILKEFLLGAQMGSTRVKKVATLIDSYLIEVAPDASLTPSKFAALVSLMPDSARDSFDKLYQAIDMYFKVHLHLSEEEKLRICSSLNYDKISNKAKLQNSKFPRDVAARVLMTRQLKSKRLLPSQCSCLEASNDPPARRKLHEGAGGRDYTHQMIVHLSKGQVPMEAVNGEPKFQSERWGIRELHKDCTKTRHSNVSHATVSGLFSPGKTGYLPKLCS